MCTCLGLCPNMYTCTHVHVRMSGGLRWDETKLREANPPIVNQQCLVYKFQCDLCDAGYVGFTSRHLHRVEEHHFSSSVGKHFHDKHSLAPKDLTKNFSEMHEQI